jgi:hypothetical protein
MLLISKTFQLLKKHYTYLLSAQSSIGQGVASGELVEENTKPKQEPITITHFPEYAGTDGGWPGTESCGSSLVLAGNDQVEADIGPFLAALFERMEHMLSNPLQVNFLLTGIGLAYYPQLMLRSFLLNHNLVVQPNVKTLVHVSIISFLYN